jgi:hypothetical protein
LFYSAGFEVALSCSMICLLQLQWQVSFPSHTLSSRKVSLSTGEKSVRLWHFVSHFPLGADLPEDCRDAEDDGEHDGRIGLPVMRLRIPTTCDAQY